MLAACEAALPADAAVFAAAVADSGGWRAPTQKIKKEPGAPPPEIRLALNPDILATVAAHATRRPRLVVGFAAETERVVEHATRQARAQGLRLDRGERRLRRRDGRRGERRAPGHRRGRGGLAAHAEGRGGAPAGRAHRGGIRP